MRTRPPFLSTCVVVMAIFYFAGCNSQEPENLEQTASLTPRGKSELQILELSEQARKNLKLEVKPARVSDYWRTITIPGIIADRPGISDRIVTSPAVGVVSEIHAYAGDTVQPGQRLVTLRLFSEYLQATQTQLFRSTQEAKLVQQQIERISDVANSGALSASRMIELRNDLQRQQTLIQASRQELLNRGLRPAQVDAVAGGEFVSTIEVNAPPPPSTDSGLQGLVSPDPNQSGQQPAAQIAYELQALNVELGQTVKAGDALANLANHQLLYVVGHAFKREASLLEQAAQNKTPLSIEFAEDATNLWPLLEQDFQIRHLANMVDSATRTLDFFVPLQNQARAYEKDGEIFLVWRFRPGQRTRIEVPVEKFSKVFVLPAEAVVREGPEAYVYRQNGDLFNQISVEILYESRTQMVIANDGSITPGTFLAQNAAASLRRVLKAQSASGEQPGLHVHADGTVHAAH